MLNIPAHLQPEYDALNDAQKDAFAKMAMAGAAGAPGNLIITDMAFERCLKYAKQMGPEPIQVIEPDKSVNHDWEFDPKQNKGK